MTIRWQLSDANNAPSGVHGATPVGARAIGLWLWCVAGLVFAMVLVGGATRLTESGLSIVEWKPVMGAVPPLGAADWQAEFEKYQTIPQYDRLNRGMSLDEFKTIYWWEWGHRLLGRLIGAAFLLPFLWFLWRRSIDRRLGLALAGIFALGAVQSAVGWWMVASGLTERVSVSQYRLAFHLTLACVIYVALVWAADRTFAFASGGPGGDGRQAPQGSTPTQKGHQEGHQEGPPLPSPQGGGEKKCARRLRWSAGALLGLVVVQIYLGALVAGLRAGLIYNTWPLIDGSLIPSAANLFFDQPLWRNFFENTLTVQFDHRMMAYGLCVFGLAHAVDAYCHGRGEPLATGAGFVAVALLAQAGIGIMTLIRGVPIEIALMHQAVALVVLTGTTLHAARTLSNSRRPS
ncbi:MAG TPA: COX15/CtaA family protein [Xanthobacteraceae bacterium]|nr:COX15/CtaA family protein [Xanthobacteraceae bacterium]